MADIKKAFTEEIRRLAKKEIKTAVSPLVARITALRRIVSAQHKELQSLKAVRPRTEAAASLEASSEKKADIRLNAKGIKRLRMKLGVTQSVFAKLIDANILSVSHWESGKSKPRGIFQQRIASLRKMGKREIVKLCEEKKINWKRQRRVSNSKAPEKAPEQPAAAQETATA